MKKTLLILIIFGNIGLIKAQNYHTIDSLKQVLQNQPSLNGTESDTLRLKTSFNIGIKFLNYMPDSARYWFSIYVDTTFSKSKIKETPRRYRINANSLRFLGITYYYLGDYRKAIYSWEKSLKTFLELNSKKNISMCYNNLGVVFDSQGDYLKAIDYYEKSLQIEEELKSKEGIASCLMNLGIVFMNQGGYKKAIEYLEKSLSIKEELNDKSGIARCLINLGSVYNLIKDFTKAVNYYEKAIKIFEDINEKLEISEGLLGLGIIYKEQGKYPYEKDLTVKEVKTPIETDLDDSKLYPKITIPGINKDTSTKSKEKWNVILKQSDLQGILNDVNKDTTLQIERLAAYYFHQLINKYRVSKGTLALYWDERLWLAARNHNVYMKTSHYFITHIQSEKTPYYTGETPWNRVEWVSGIKYFGSGENILAGRFHNNLIESIAMEMAEISFDGWKNSPGHNKNMLSKTYGCQGTAFIYGYDGCGAWFAATTDFGGDKENTKEFDFLEESEIVKKYKNTFVIVDYKIISLNHVEKYKDSIYNIVKSFMPSDTLANDETLKLIASKHILYLETNNTSNTTQSRKKNNFYASTTKKRFLKATKYRTLFYLAKHILIEKCYVIPVTAKEFYDNTMLTKIDKKIKGVFPKKTGILKWGAAVSFKEKNNQYYCIIDIVWIVKK